MESPDGDDSDGEKSASGMDMKKGLQPRIWNHPMTKTPMELTWKQRNSCHLSKKKVEDQGLQVPNFLEYRYVNSFHQFYMFNIDVFIVAHFFL